MPLVTVHLIENVFTDEEKVEMITKLTDTMVSIQINQRLYDQGLLEDFRYL
ncbi:MAG: hypothetical protein H6974_10235 [Gammaproteobacteria bacterium]|nr:hypothetical protein [Gammaproteobacteria bacterium]